VQLSLTLALVLGACSGVSDGAHTQRRVTGQGGRTEPLRPTTAPRGRGSYAYAFTDGKLLVFGGEVPGSGAYVGSEPPRPTRLNDGALYDVATKRWVELPDPPFDGPLDAPKALGADGSFVVVGINCPKRTWDDSDGWDCDVRAPMEGAIYRSDIATWQAIDLPSTVDDWWAIGTMGTEAVFGVGRERLVLIDTATNRARVVTRPPFELVPRNTCVSDAGVTAVRVTDESDIDIETDPLPLRLDAVVLEPSGDAWSAPVTLVEGTAPRLFAVYCAGRSALVLPTPRRQLDGCEIESFLFSGQRWRRITPPPVDVGFLRPQVWTGAELVIWGGAEYFGDPSARAYNPNTDSWRKVDQPPIAYAPVRLWTGTDVLLYHANETTGDAVSHLTLP
jgi:hypothetical protein